MSPPRILARPSLGRLSIGLAVAAASLGFAGIAAAEPPPIWAVYGEPGPAPVPDTVAKEFVDRAAPSLREITAEELARGVVVGGGPAAATPGPVAAASSPASTDAGRPRPVAQIQIDRALLERAGVGQGAGGLDPRLGYLLAAVLAAAGLAVVAPGVRRSS